MFLLHLEKFPHTFKINIEARTHDQLSKMKSVNRSRPSEGLNIELSGLGFK